MQIEIENRQLWMIGLDYLTMQIISDECDQQAKKGLFAQYESSANLDLQVHAQSVHDLHCSHIQSDDKIHTVYEKYAVLYAHVNLALHVTRVQRYIFTCFSQVPRRRF